MTSVAQGVRSDSKLNKGKFFFFSTARSINTFREAFGLPQKAAVLVLDGRKLSQRYKAAAVDYWGPGFMDQDETEDRIVTDDPYIDDFSQYIKEVRILFPVKSFRSVSFKENEAVEKSIDILKGKNIPVKLLTQEKYFFINNPKNFMTTKEEWREFLEKNKYTVSDKKPVEDDIGTNIRKATPFNDAANLAALIKMVDAGDLDFMAFPSHEDMMQVKNDLYKHLVDPDGDGVEPQYDDEERERIKKMMMTGQSVISSKAVQDIYTQIVYYPRDFAPSVGTSIQNNRKNPDSRESLTVISKYMRKNKLKDIETLGAFLKTKINAIKDGKMQKVAESIVNKILEKKYKVNNPVLWSASYSEMIEFANTGDFFIPLGEDFLKRALGTEPTKGSVFHVTDVRGVYGLLNMQGKKKAVAGFTQLGDTVADKMFTSGVGAGRSSGFVVKLDGDILTSFYRDARTRPEKGGRRNIKLATLQKSIGRQGFMKVRKEIIQKLHQYNEKAGAKSKIPTQSKLPRGEDATVVLDAWRKQIVRAQKPGPRMIKRYKEQGKPIPKGDGKKFAEMIKYYLDTVEEVVKNNQEMFKKAIIDADMGEKGGYTGYDEKNIENFKVSRVFVVQDSPAYKDLKKSDIVSDLKKEKITLLPITTQQMVDYINKTNVTFASVFKEENKELAGKIMKKFEEKSDWVPKGVVNRESYGDMIEFNSFYDLFFPLGSTLLKRALGDLPENVKGFHIGNLNGMKGLISIQGSKKQISTFTRGAKKEFIRDGITGRGGCVAEVEGRLITSSMKDIFSLPEKNGRRNILLGNLLGLIQDPSASDPIVEDLIDAMAEWTEKNAEPTVVPKGSKMYQPEVVRAWNRAREDADGKMKHEMVKFYLDTTEAVMKKHSKTIEYALLNPFKSSVTNYTAMDIYDENVMDKIKVKNIYFLNTYYNKRGMVGHPDDEEFKEFIEEMKSRGIDVYKAKAKEIVDMIDNSLSDKGATKYFEEELTEAGGDLSYLLLPVGQTQQIGAEKQDKKTKDGIERYSNKFGSYRYVMVMDGETVGAIQVMSRDKSKGVAANVFVKPEFRRQGIAKRLLVQAKKDFDEVEYNPDQSDDGKAWVASVNESKGNSEWVDRVLRKARENGFTGMKGQCAGAAVAINDILFNGEAKLIAAVNQYAYEELDTTVGHVAVLDEETGKIWDVDGEISKDKLESWGMIDPEDPDYKFPNEEAAYEVKMIWQPAAIQMILDEFGECDASLGKKREILKMAAESESLTESIYSKIIKESHDPSTLSSIWNVVERRDLSRLTQLMLSDDACCDTETISGLWDESDPQDAMHYLLPEPEWREWDDSDWEDEEDWTEKEMAKRREYNKGISMEEIYKSREELGEISRELLARDGIAQKSPDGTGAVVKVWRCGVTEGQPVTSVTWSEQYAYKFCTGKKAYHKDDTEVDAYYINLQDVLVSIPHIWESGYREWELLVHPKDLVPVQGYERKNNTSSISETVYNKVLKGL